MGALILTRPSSLRLLWTQLFIFVVFYRLNVINFRIILRLFCKFSFKLLMRCNRKEMKRKLNLIVALISSTRISPFEVVWKGFGSWLPRVAKCCAQVRTDLALSKPRADKAMNTILLRLWIRNPHGSRFFGHSNLVFGTLYCILSFLSSMSSCFYDKPKLIWPEIFCA